MTSASNLLAAPVHGDDRRMAAVVTLAAMPNELFTLIVQLNNGSTCRVNVDGDILRVRKNDIYAIASELQQYGHIPPDRIVNVRHAFAGESFCEHEIAVADRRLIRTYDAAPRASTISRARALAGLISTTSAVVAVAIAFLSSRSS